MRVPGKVAMLIVGDVDQLPSVGPGQVLPPDSDPREVGDTCFGGRSKERIPG